MPAYNAQELNDRVRNAVALYWQTRNRQKSKQAASGRTDQGLRSAVTGGAQMDGFIDLIAEITVLTGISDRCIYRKKAVEIPGFFRPTKEWDLLVVKDGILLSAIESKSQTGPSFGNNFNNRIEEALGSAGDFWTAFREGAYKESPQPFLGYIFLLEDCAGSTRPVSVKEPHFKVFGEFRDASYMKRYEIFCRKLVLERHYTAAAFLTSNSERGVSGEFAHPSNDLTIERFIRMYISHISSFA